MVLTFQRYFSLHIFFCSETRKFFSFDIDETWFSWVFIVIVFLFFTSRTTLELTIFFNFTIQDVTEVAYSVRLACGESGFDLRLQQTWVVKIGSDSPTAKRSATGGSVRGPRVLPLQTNAQCDSRVDTLKNPRWTMAKNAEHRSKYPAINGSSDLSVWVKTPWVGHKQIKNKQTNTDWMYDISIVQRYIVHYPFSNSVWHIKKIAYKV